MFVFINFFFCEDQSRGSFIFKKCSNIKYIDIQEHFLYNLFIKWN